MRSPQTRGCGIRASPRLLDSTHPSLGWELSVLYKSADERQRLQSDKNHM